MHACARAECVDSYQLPALLCSDLPKLHDIKAVHLRASRHDGVALAQLHAGIKEVEHLLQQLLLNVLWVQNISSYPPCGCKRDHPILHVGKEIILGVAKRLYFG